MALTPKDIKEVHDRITEVLVQGAEIKGEMKGIHKRLDEYERPCAPLAAIIKERDSERAARDQRNLADIQFWDGVKSKVLGSILVVALLFVIGAVYFALAHGYSG